jgi:hypothetical protein
MRGLAAGGAGVSILAVFLAAASLHQVRGDEPGEGARPADPASATGGEETARPPARPVDPCDGGQRVIESYRELYPDSLPFRHLVVLLPDPVEAADGELFDLAIEGVEEAVSEDNGDGKAYVHDQQWLPWSDAPVAARCWEKQPGVSVFRPLEGPGRQSPLLVLFVGETPLRGLRAAQLDAAIDLVRRHDSMAGRPDRPFLLLGPTYSGTAASLDAVIHRPSMARSQVRIVSGTATTVRARQILLHLSPSPLPGRAVGVKGRGAADPCAPPPTTSGRISFETATATDTCLLAKMEEFLVTRGGTCNRSGEDGNIALFTETSTTYGSAGTDSVSESRRPGASCFRRWKLPPDLASIRESTEERATSGSGDKQDARPARSVAVHALALRSTLDRMSNSKIRFAGIVATDPRDVLFLARRFRQQLPDIRLFTLAARIQYLDEKAADAVNGMLVVHSAPGDGNHSMSLQNEFVRKIYYSARRLLGDDKLDPEVHVSFIGSGRLWRIDDFGRSSDFARARDGRGPIWPVGWQFTFAAFAVLFIAVIVIVVLGARKGCWRPRGRLWALVAPCTHEDLRRQDCTISAALVLVCGGPLVLMLETMIARQGWQPDHWVVCAAAAVLMMRLAWLFHVDGHRAPVCQRPVAVAMGERVRRGLMGARRCATCLSLSAPIVVLLLALYVGCGPERRATFYLLSGGSPVLVGLIAMGSYALALLCARMRLRMLDSHRFRAGDGALFVHMVPPIAQALGEERGKQSGLADVEYRLLATLYHPWKYARVMPLAVHGLLVLTMAVPIFIKPPHTMEPGWRNVALIAVAIVAAVTASINLAWFLGTWTRFMRFLRRLACSPAIDALARLPDRRPRPLGEQLAWSGSEGTQLVYAVEILGRVAEVDETVRETYATCRALLEQKLSTEATRRPAAGPELADVLLETSRGLAARRCDPDVPQGTRERFDEFAASLVDLFIPRYVRHFRLFVPPMILGCMCSVFLPSLYLVQPQRLIGSVAFFWVAVTVAVVLVSYVSLEVDPVLSAVSGSAAGKVSSRLGLARRILIWGAVPVASYLAVDHPEFPLWVSRILEFVGKSLR